MIKMLSKLLFRKDFAEKWFKKLWTITYLFIITSWKYLDFMLPSWSNVIWEVYTSPTDISLITSSFSDKMKFLWLLTPAKLTWLIQQLWRIVKPTVLSSIQPLTTNIWKETSINILPIKWVSKIWVPSCKSNTMKITNLKDRFQRNQEDC